MRDSYNDLSPWGSSSKSNPFVVGGDIFFDMFILNMENRVLREKFNSFVVINRTFYITNVWN